MAGESELTIRELTGRQRSVTLRGPSLPLQGAPWGGTQRVETTWYPGNAEEATQQVLGPTESESNWNGQWNTTRMVRTPAKAKIGSSDITITQAFVLQRIVEDLFRKGQLLRVQWSNKGQDIVREGRCINWDFAYDRIDDIRWTAKFAWKGRGGRQQRVISFRREDPTSGINDTILAGNEVLTLSEFGNSIVSSRRTVRKSATRFTLGQLENLANAPSEILRSFARKVQQIVGRFDQVAGIVKTVRAIPFQLANQVVDQAANAISVSNQFVDDMSRRPPEANSLDAKVTNVSRTAEFFGSSIRASYRLRRTANSLKSRVRGQQEDRRTILAVHIARGGQFGEPLARISYRFYNTPDRGPDIARANLLPIDQQFVPTGSVVIIPTLDAIRAFSNNG